MSTSYIDRQIDNLLKYNKLAEEDVKHICDLAIKTLIQEKNVLLVDSPVTVCGDIHGQFFDLKKLFETGGFLPETNYLFLGDYVDRGYDSVYTFLLLLSLKIRYPDRITLLRGNHELKITSEVYGFYAECIQKYGSSTVWSYCVDVFKYLSLAAIIDGKIFCVHGGLSPLLKTIDDINAIDRVQDEPLPGLMTDLLWSDPDEGIKNYKENRARGCGSRFGSDAVSKFLSENDIDWICRGHELVNDGYQWNFGKTVLTIFSAPNYCYRCNSTAAMVHIDQNLSPHIYTFTKADEQYFSTEKQLPDSFL